jgi:hypothetical protein
MMPETRYVVQDMTATPPLPLHLQPISPLSFDAQLNMLRDMYLYRRHRTPQPLRYITTTTTTTLSVFQRTNLRVFLLDDEIGIRLQWGLGR